MILTVIIVKNNVSNSNQTLFEYNYRTKQPIYTIKQSI